MAKYIDDDAVASLADKKKIFDTHIKGFGVRRQGDKVSFFLRYRMKDPTRVKVVDGIRKPYVRDTFYTLNATKAAAARKEAETAWAKVRLGQDPFAGDRQAKTAAQGLTLKEYVDQIYRPIHMAELKPSTQRYYDRYLKNYILPYFEGKLLAAINGADLLGLIEATKGRSIVVRSQCLDVLQSVFVYAFDDKKLTSVVLIRRPKWMKKQLKASRRPLLTLEDDDQKALLSSLEEYRTKGLVTGKVGKLHVIPGKQADCLEVIFLTGARRNEIQALKWEYLDLDAGIALLPNTKTEPRKLYLPDAVVAILRRQTRLKGNPFVFWGLRSKTGYMTNLNRYWQALREHAGLPKFRIHDMRHNFISRAADADGMEIQHVAELAGHASLNTTKQYFNHKSIAKNRARANRIAGILKA